MKLFERVRQELIALGFSEVDGETFFSDGNDQFEATKDGVCYCFSQYWQDFVLDGPNELYWGNGDKQGTITFNWQEEPGKGIWKVEE